MKLFKQAIVILILISGAVAVHAQDFMMQGFYWQYQQFFGNQNYAQNLQGRIPDMKEAGFTYLWLPPLSRGSADTASIGYDVMDYYDLGEYGLGPTRFGSRTDVNNIISALHSSGIQPVADMLFDDRNGGVPEINNSVKGWIENYTAASVSAGDNPYPSDRFFCYILLGGASGNSTGTYYVKIRSASLSSNFYNFPYTFEMWTHRVRLPADSLTLAMGSSWEYEPNNGGDCSDTSNFYNLGTAKYAHVDPGGCGIDEFRLKLDTSMFDVSGDTLFISMANTNPQTLGDYSDQYVHGIWYDSLAADLYSQVQYMTYTDFTHVASGKGYMNWSNFKPNGNPTNLNGDWDEMLFFYDVDQTVTSTQTTLEDYSEWMFDSVGIGGMRLDAVKNYTYAYVSQVLNYLNQHNHNPHMVVGEYYDYSATNLTGYIANVNSGLTQSTLDSVNMRVFDFALRGALKSACDQFGYDERNLFSSGMVLGAGGSAANSVTFVNNLDFRNPGTPVTNNPELAYAYILTNNMLGVPCVYYLDYYSSGFMRGRIKGLMHANQRWINGATWADYLSNISSPHTQYFVSGFNTTTVIYQEHNPATNDDVIVAINFAGDTLDVYQQVNMTNVAVGDTFTDMFGVAMPPTLTTITPNQELHVKLPPRSFTVYVQGNHADSLISLSDTLEPLGPGQPTDIQPQQPQSRMARIYPNPFSSKIMVVMNSTSDEDVSVEICDITGRSVYADRMTTSGDKLFIDPAIQSPGVYFVRLTAGGRSETYRMVKEE